MLNENTWEKKMKNNTFRKIMLDPLNAREAQRKYFLRKINPIARATNLLIQR